MSKGPLLSINLPTYNGEATIRKALESVKAQTYKNYEIVIVDHCSTDRTLEIAKEYTQKIYLDKKRLLNSRKIGLAKSKGEIIVFLSCDQVMSPTMLQKVVDMYTQQDIDMIVTEEQSFKPTTLIEKLTALDRKLVQEAYELDPYKGVILPSVYKKKLLQKIFPKFSEPLLATITIHDHAIIYHEAYKLSRKIGLIPKAIYHDEPKTAWELFSHYMYWGKRGKAVKNVLPKEYEEMFASKMNYRLKNLTFSLNTLKILPIILIKGLGFKIGYYFG